MGFQVEESKEPRFFTKGDENANGPFDHSRGFEIHEGSNTPLNIITKKDQVFGVTSNLNAKETHYTSFRGGSSSFMSSGPDLSLSLMDREMMMTNYENNLEWGKTGLNLYNPGSYHKISKTPTIHYMPPRAGPIQLNDPLPVARRSDLPLVDLPGFFASKRRWDDKGTLIINRSKSPRFAANS